MHGGRLVVLGQCSMPLPLQPPTVYAYAIRRSQCLDGHISQMTWNDQLRLHVGLRSTGVPEWRSERWLAFADRAAGQGVICKA
jgi:hypothetical protein